MGKSVFSVPIFFIVFRETLEAAVIVSTLLGLVEQIARPQVQVDGLFVHDWKNRNHVHHDDKDKPPVQAQANEDDKKTDEAGQSPVLPSLENENEEDVELASRRLMRKLRIQVSLLLPPSPSSGN